MGLGWAARAIHPGTLVIAVGLTLLEKRVARLVRVPTMPDLGLDAGDATAH